MAVAADISFQAEALRDELKRCGIELSLEAANRLLLKTGNHGIALDAMLMEPRSGWLKALLLEAKPSK